MHVVGHDHPGSQLIEMSSALALQEGIGHHPRYSIILQPNRCESGFVHFAVQGEEGPAAGSRCGSGRLRQSSPRDGTGQAPSNKQEGCLSEIIGMPVGKLSAVEHNGLAGESACPTYRAWTGGKSQKNVETPGPGFAGFWSGPTGPFLSNLLERGDGANVGAHAEVCVAAMPGGSVISCGRIRTSTWPSSELLVCRLVRGPRKGMRVTPARPEMVRAWSRSSNPATEAHSPKRSSALFLITRLEITGMPLTDEPVSTLNSESISSVTDSMPCTAGVSFRVRPRSSKVNDGGGVYTVPPWLKLGGP